MRPGKPGRVQMATRSPQHRTSEPARAAFSSKKAASSSGSLAGCSLHESRVIDAPFLGSFQVAFPPVLQQGRCSMTSSKHMCLNDEVRSRKWCIRVVTLHPQVDPSYSFCRCGSQWEGAQEERSEVLWRALERAIPDIRDRVKLKLVRAQAAVLCPA